MCPSVPHTGAHFCFVSWARSFHFPIILYLSHVSPSPSPSVTHTQVVSLTFFVPPLHPPTHAHTHMSSSPKQRVEKIQRHLSAFSTTGKVRILYATPHTHSPQLRLRCPIVRRFQFIFFSSLQLVHLGSPILLLLISYEYILSQLCVLFTLLYFFCFIFLRSCSHIPFRVFSPLCTSPKSHMFTLSTSRPPLLHPIHL